MDGIIETYAELLEALKKLTPEQLQQKPQAYLGTSDDSVPIVCQPVFSLGTVRDGFEIASEDGSRIEDHQYVRDASDGKHHSDAVVMQMDYSGYEDDTDQRLVRLYEKTLMKIISTAVPGEPAWPFGCEEAKKAIEKAEKIKEKRKTKILKECV